MTRPPSPERQARVMAIFERALDRDAAERPALLAAECGDDAALRREVEALLEADAGASGFLERPPAAAARAVALARGTATNRSTAAPARPESGAALLAWLQQAIGADYRVERELDGGGMSHVFLAEETRLRRRVVVKLLPPELARALDVERFHREVRVAATLRHPHIVPLLAAGESGDGLLYYTMPYIEGESLRARLARNGPLPAADVARVVREVADALAYAHRRGVVHRDVKPANVLVDGDHVLVTDFGIAKALSAASDAPPPDAEASAGGWGASLTARGLVVGTPAYMSPEQARGDRVDGRSDVYSLALMTFELLTGTRPPTTEPGTDPRTALRRASGSGRGGARLPRALEEVLARARAPDPADRHQTADELARAVDAALAAPVGPWSRAGVRRGAAVAAGVALVALGAAAWVATRAPAGPTAAAAATSRNAAASESYRRGLALARGAPKYTRQAREGAVQAFERAVALDPAFAAAWARLALAHARMYETRDDGSAARLARARAAAARAAALDSTLPEVALALGEVVDTRWQAVERYVVALRAHPDHPELLQALGWQQLALGRAADALASFTRAAALDPRSPDWPAEIANIHDGERAYGEAVRVRARQIALDSANAAAYVAQALSYVNWRGDTAAARATLAQAAAAAGRARLVQMLAGGSGVRVAPLLWPALDAETRRALDTLSVAGAARPAWRVYRLKAEHFARGGHAALARAYHDSTRRAALAALAVPGGGAAHQELHEALGIAYAGLGLTAEALSAGRRAVALDTADVSGARWSRFAFATIAARAGAVDEAFRALAGGLPSSVPSVTAYWLRLDPTWAPLRADPRFRPLLDGAP